MKVTVDFDMCASTGGCMQVCPEVFEVRSDGYLYILQEEPGGVCTTRCAKPPNSARRRRSNSRTEPADPFVTRIATERAAARGGVIYRRRRGLS